MKPPRKSPMTPAQVKSLRASIIELITQEPRTCRFLSLRHGFCAKTLTKYLNEMRDDGLIHSTKPAGAQMKIPFKWTLGPGAHVVLPAAPKPCKGEDARQNRVTSWPPLKIKPQHIWSAVMD